jgi:hypothetical protein
LKLKAVFTTDKNGKKGECESFFEFHFSTEMKCIKERSKKGKCESNEAQCNNQHKVTVEFDL